MPPLYRCLQNIRPLLSKYKPNAFKIYALPFQNPQSTHTTSDIAIKGIGDDVQDLTTGVTTRSLSGVEGERAGNDTTRLATQVCRRRVESGLGGHEEGVGGVDDRIENASLRCGNGCERRRQNVRPSVILPGLQTMLPMGTEITVRKQHGKRSHDSASFNSPFSLR